MRAPIFAAVFALVALIAAVPAGAADWTRGPDMVQAESYASAASVDGRYYVLGGAEAQAGQVFDPSTGRWTALTPPPVNRSQTGGAAVGRVVYVFGGCVNSDCSYLTGDNWAYDTATGVWTQRAPMATPRQGMAAVVIDGKIYVAGGYTARFVRSDELTAYDPVANVWTTLAPMPLARGYGAAGAIGKKLYFAGGTSSGWGQQTAPQAEVMAYDTRSGVWSMRAPLPTGLALPGGAAMNGKFYVMGGLTPESSVGTSATWVYDPAANAWSTGPAMNEGRAYPMTAANGGTLFVSGGTRGGASFEYERLTGRAPAVFKNVSKSSPERPSAEPPPPDEPDVNNPSPRAAARPDDYALVIGIENYSRLPDASFAENDADAMKKNLLALGYPERNVVLLKGEKATRGAVQGYVEEWLPRNVHPDSRVFVYFSGHGSPDTKNGDAYLVPWDGDAMFLKSTAYPLESLYASLGRLKVKHVIVALDSCFSGAGGRSVLVAGARPLVSRVDLTGAPSGVTVLTAASGDEITGTIDARSHGAFTYYLLKSLNRPKPTVKAVYDELKPLVQDEAHRQNREQTPLMLGDDASF